MLVRELELCKEALASLMSDQNKYKNYLFLEPVNLNHVPDYLSVIARPMDLGTIKKNMGNYPTVESFWRDVQLVFDNAIIFHKDRKDTEFIVKLAKDMIKLTNKERRLLKKKLESANNNGGNNNSSGGGTTKKSPGLKLKLSKGGSSSSGSKPKNSSSSSTTATSSDGTGRTKLKLKGLSSSSSSDLKPSASATTPATHGSSSSSSAPVKKTKLKLKLSLSLNKNKGMNSSSSSSTSKKSPSPLPTPSSAATNKSSSSSSSTATATPSSATSSSTPTQKIRITPPSRGKELPKGVTAPTPKPSKSSSSNSKSSSNSSGGKSSSSSSTKKKQTKSRKKSSTPTPTTTPSSGLSSSSSPGAGTSNRFDAVRRAQCLKILSGLKRRQAKNVSWFTHPVSEKNFDKALCADYKAKIAHPMDLGTMQQRVEKMQYKTVSEFVLDLRRIFGNCLRFNTTKEDPVRPVAINMLVTAEQLMAHFLGPHVTPPLLYCWNLCLSLLNALLNVTNPSNGHQTAHFFLHPASYFFGGSFPPDYKAKIKQPMDLGTVTSNLVEGKYQSVQQFSNDCRLIIQNCLTYYADRDDGQEFTQQAMYLRKFMSQQLDALQQFDQSPQASRTAAKSAPKKLQTPPQALLLSILVELRAVQYTDRLTKLSEPAMRHFEKPVDLTIYKDYLKFVGQPMDLQTIENKVKAGSYATPEDFEYDVHLIFKNCEAFNAPRKTDQLVAIGKYGAKEFRKLFSKRMKTYENPEGATEPKRQASSPAPAPPSKRSKTSNETGGKQAASRANTSQHHHRGSITSTNNTTTNTTTAASTSATSNGGPGSVVGGKRSKSPKVGSSKKSSKSPPTVPKGNQPVPLHVAIAEVKQRFPLRRHLKFLDPWEAGCAKFFKELMKHPWISAARPKFIFHVPVPVIFPQLAPAYLQKIKKPMDLTTAEAKLLKGGEYFAPQDFIDDVALVFSNAITFNRAGRDEGDHLSMAYYDASIHLLNYARWLSLEHLVKFFVDDDHVDEATPDGIPPTGWKLSKANRKKGRQEMESIVLNEQIEKSVEGDRTYTWMESECEKLLKALRHQSDLRYMTFFIQPNYPDDYTAFISKPMDWERVQRTLQKRQYNKFSEIIEDLRLIFSNALKYNARHKGMDTVSGRAYDAAIHMSEKLEAAIDKMMLAVSDRLERERIEHAMGEREIEAAERAEAERIRAAMKEAGNNDASGVASSKATGLLKPSSGGATASANAKSSSSTTATMMPMTTTIETIRRRPVASRRDMDFEVPFFDEDDGNLEQSHVEMMKQQRATFERQRQERATLLKISMSIGALVFARHAQFEQAQNWLQQLHGPEKQQTTTSATTTSNNNDNSSSNEKDVNQASSVDAAQGPSAVLAALNRTGRKTISLQPKALEKKKKKSRKRKRALLTLE